MCACACLCVCDCVPVGVPKGAPRLIDCFVGVLHVRLPKLCLHYSSCLRIHWCANALATTHTHTHTHTLPQAYDVNADGSPYQFRSLVMLLTICGQTAGTSVSVSVWK